MSLHMTGSGGIHHTAAVKAVVADIALTELLAELPPEAAALTGLDIIVEIMNLKYAWIEKVGRVFRIDHRDFVTIEMLQKQYANTAIDVPTLKGPKTVSYALAWHRSENRRDHKDVVFSPGCSEIDDGNVNLWNGWPVKPVTGDISPWSDLLDFLFTNHSDERAWFEKWCACPIQHPGAKLNTAVVLWSATQGVGKSLVGETLGRLYGLHFKVISATELHSPYNGWARDCQFVLGEENSSADHRADANRLKHLITGTTVFVNEKYVPAMEMKNRINFLFTSNHADAFHIDDHDRRLFVWEVVAPKKPDEFYRRFVEWRDSPSGMMSLMNHLLHLDLSGFNPKVSAPMTAAKDDMIQNSRTDLERWLREVLEAPSVVTVFGKEVSTYEDLVAVYHGEHRGRTNVTALGRAMRRILTPEKRRVSVAGRRRHLIPLSRHEHWKMQDDTIWADEYLKTRSLIH